MQMNTYKLFVRQEHLDCGIRKEADCEYSPASCITAWKDIPFKTTAILAPLPLVSAALSVSAAFLESAVILA